MRRTSIYSSMAFHAVVLLIAVMGLPLLPAAVPDMPPPITVDLVDIAKVTQTKKFAPQPAPPQPKQKPQPAPSHPVPAPTNRSSTAVTPTVAPPLPEDRPPEKTEVADKNALPKKIKKKDKAKLVKKEKQQDFAAVLRNLEDSTPKPAQQAGQNAPLADRMTMSEEDALRGQLESCWNVPVGAKGVQNMSVSIFMVINQNRTLQSARIVDTARYGSDPVFQSVADSALRAVRNPKCSPFDLPPDKYSVWNTITVTFNPKDMF
ncbi:MAG: hypothetical protein KGL10_02565 [Alphaproteobacteria bacterium]|nr:hypothetical protein [Alphaproteobacteria bacterium]MDE2336172.1 hypothetical protein [Alphaproteobacteria bacterium]